MKAISITSGKGGVGKSSVTVNMAVELARQGRKVLLFDADMGLANLDIMLDITPKYNLMDVIQGQKEISSILEEGPYGLKVIPATSGILTLERLSPAQRVQIASGLEDASKNFDYLFIDTGAGLSENVLFFNACCDEILVVTLPEPTAITDAYALIKILITAYDVESVVLIVNRVTHPAEGFEVFNKLNGVCNRFLGKSIRFGGAINNDSAVSTAIKKRQPVAMTSPKSIAATQFKELVDKFDLLFPTPPRGLRKEFWDKFFSRRTNRTE